jgi:hypothetical protein
MGEGKQESNSSDSLDDLFEPGFGDISEELLEELVPLSSEKQRLVEKRRQAELRVEQKRLRDELGDYDLELEF